MQLFYILVLFYLEIARQVKEVICVVKIIVNFLRKILYCILIWNVPDHNSSTRIIADFIKPYFKDISLKLFHMLITCILAIEVHRMIIHRLLIIHRTGITFLNRLIDWKNTPNFTIRICLLLMRSLMFQMIRLLPLILYSLWLYSIQYTVRWLPNYVGRLLKSLLCQWFFINLTLAKWNCGFFLFWWLACFYTLGSFRHSFFILPFLSNKTRQVRPCNIKLNIQSRHTGKDTMLGVRR